MDFSQNNEPDSFLEHMDSDVEQGNLEKGCVNNTNGIVTIVFVYLLFIFEYFMTVYFGIWH